MAKKKKKKVIIEDEKKPTDNKKILKITIICVILFGIICLLWARFISTSGLIVKEYPIYTTELGESFDGFKIVQFSDLHYGSTIGLKELKKTVKEINSLKPDIIIFTGDLVEQDVTLSDKEVNNIITELNKLEPRIETLAVIGNHDYDHDYWNKIVPNLDWIVLDNTYEYVYNNISEKLVFVGFDDLTEGTPDYSNAFSFLNEQTEKIYTIVLAHEPDQVDEISDYEFDLVLSGHSHLGQVRFPLIGALYTPKGSKKYYDEHYKVGDADLYINGGIGTSLMKLRFFNKPSINLYRFYTK